MKHRSLIARSRILILVLVLCCICSCTPNLPVSEAIKLQLCGAHAVPGMYNSDMKSGGINILDTDSEGRILFEYSARDVIGGEHLEEYRTVLVICQKYDDDYVYFYEDICYLKQYDTDEAIDRLKEQNDWGKALDESKCSRRPILLTFDLFAYTEENIPYEQVKKSVMVAISLQEDQIQELCLLDVDTRGGVLYYLCYDADSIREKYLVLVTWYGNTYLHPIENDEVDPVALAQFKKDSGWVY